VGGLGAGAYLLTGLLLFIAGRRLDEYTAAASTRGLSRAAGA
jgi:hypothetical protein